MFSSFLMIGRSSRGVNAASEKVLNREGKFEVSQCESKTTESSWVQMDATRNFLREKMEKPK